MDVIYALLITAVIGAIRTPDDAFGELHGSDRLKGVFPQLSADYLGILGSLCVAYGLGHRRVRWLPAVVGTAFVIVAQHRTGLVAIAVVVIVRLLYQKRTSLTIAGMIAATALAIVALSGVADSLWLRGQAPEEIGTLSNRTEWWSEGIDAVGRSPVTGLGLSSGSRYEVFINLDADSPHLHGTWPEVLVGTGIVGLVILASAYGLAVVDAARSARPGLWLVPLLFLVALGVNSTTHTTFELGSLAFLVFLFAVGAGSPVRAGRPAAPETGDRTTSDDVMPAG
jgi:O-antigen ligase